jgi:predicted PurR-regulated permease PerM
MEEAQKRSRAALALVLTIAAAFVAKDLLPAVAWAAVIAIGVDPVRRRLLERAPGRRNAVAAVLTVAIVMIVLVPLAYGVTKAAMEAGHAAAWLRHARMAGIPAPEWISSLPMESTRVQTWWNMHLSDPVALASMTRRVDMAEWAGRSREIGRHVLHGLLSFAFISMSLFFMLRDRDHLLEQAERATRRAFGEAGPRLGRQILASIRGTVDGVVLVGLAQGALLTVVMFACGMPHPMLFGLLAGIGAMVPLGIGLVAVMAGLILLAGGSPVGAAVVIGTAFAVHFVAEHFVKPAMIGGATSMPFLLVLLGLVGGLETIGLLGLFVGPAVMAALVMIWRDYVSKPVQIEVGEARTDSRT